MKYMKNIYRVKPTKRLGVRFRETVKRVDLIEPVMDAGGRNHFAESLGIDAFVEGDLNKRFVVEMKMATVTSFEVIEHLQNPLLYLDSIYDALKVGGRLYLTTPARWILKGKYHYHEFNKKELVFLLHMAGFKNVQMWRMRAYDLRHWGVRPLIRWMRDVLVGQCYFVKAYK